MDHVRGSDTVVQLVGVPKPAPWKGRQFRAVDRLSGLASIQAAQHAGVKHFVYISVAHPVPVMKDYIAVRAEIESVLRGPWYILGPGHWWPIFLKPAYRVCERIPSNRPTATRPGLVTLQQMLVTLLWSVEHLPESARVIEVPEIRTLGGLEQ